MKRTLIIIIAMVTFGWSSYGQVKETVEYLKPIEISEKQQNEFTGKYKIEGEKRFFIEVSLTDNGMVIIVPDIENSKGKSETNLQYAMLPQYEDKFYLKKDGFIKVHFTRSKRNKKVISLLFNADKDNTMKNFRAKKVK